MANSTILFSSGYGKITNSYQNHVKFGSFARGIDLIDTDVNGNVYGASDVRAYRSGIVRYAGSGDGYGLCVFIEHAENIWSVYGHLSRLDVSVGDEVNRGKVIGKIGTTGNSTGIHLHFSIRNYFIKPTAEGFWSKNGINDTDIFTWIDPTGFIFDPTDIKLDSDIQPNRYKVRDKNGKQLNAFTSLDNAFRYATSVNAYVFDSVTNKYLNNKITEKKQHINTLQYVLDYNVLDDDVRDAIKYAINILKTT